MEDEQSGDHGRAPRWLLPEARTVLQAQRKEIMVPSKPIRGAMIALPRRSTEAPDDRVTPFGKFTGWLYREGYRQWAKENPNHYPDLAAFAAWAKATGEKTATTANKRALGWPLAQRRGDQ